MLADFWFLILLSLINSIVHIFCLIKHRLNLGNACYYSVHGLLSSRILSRNIKLTLKEEKKLWIFENKILRKIFSPKKRQTGEWRKLHNVELHNLKLFDFISWMLIHSEFYLFIYLIHPIFYITIKLCC